MYSETANEQSSRWGETTLVPAFPLSVCICVPPKQPRHTRDSSSGGDQALAMPAFDRWNSGSSLMGSCSALSSSVVRQRRTSESKHNDRWVSTVGQESLRRQRVESQLMLLSKPSSPPRKPHRRMPSIDRWDSGSSLNNGSSGICTL